ncbi:MAG TPA: translation factor GTPase family protein, partial [Candidatus Saccharimonadales bacterium]|nr:translation factor GTPase family protein [Candidatus Saccharimonadales bacterium]
MKYLNLGILAHVDAGKTSLTERLLYVAGVIKHVGSVDAGNTQTDSLALERQRGITIKSAVASFDIGDTRVNLIDTPGHPDFIAEVERVLSVLDGVVLVISAVEGVQPQTRILMRALQRLNIPTVIFVNKIDRMGARYESLLDDIATKLKVEATALGTVENIGQPDAHFVLNNDILTGDSVPVFFGSAMTGEGVGVLMAALPSLLPNANGDTKAKASGTIFKIERGQRGEKIAYIRMFSGTIRAREKLAFGKVTGLQVFAKGQIAAASELNAGGIGKIWGLDSAQVGDSIGEVAKSSFAFAAPTLEAAVIAKDPAEQPMLHAALKQLAEQDPLITLRQIDQKLYVSLYGEVQKEVISATLTNDFAVEVTFERTQPICIERPIGNGYAVQLLQEESNPTSATVGLHIEPGAPGSGIVFKLDVHPRLVPLYIYKHTGNFTQHMTDYIHQTLKSGLHGLEVTDCIVTMTDCGSYTGDGPAKPFSDTPKTTAADFRKL